MGILDGFLGTSWDDPRTAAMLGLAGGLLEGSPMKGLLAMQQANSPDAALKREYMKAQIDETKAQADQRVQAAQRQKYIQDYVTNMLSGGGAAQPSGPAMSAGAFAPAADGMGPTLQAPQAQGANGGAASGSRLANMNIDQVAALHAIGGPNLLDYYKWVKDPLKKEAGSTYVDRATGVSEYMPKLDNGMVPGAGGSATMMPGYAEAQARQAGMTQGAQEDAKAARDLVQVYNPATKAMEFVPRSRVLNGAQASQPAAQMPPARIAPEPGVRGSFSGDPAQIMESIIQIKDPQERANAMAAFTEQAKRTPSFAASGFQAQASGVQAGPSTSDKLAADAGGEINKTWLDTSYKPTLAAGDTAANLITNVQSARMALKGVGGGGFGTETRAAAANVLASLGVPQAEKFASNAAVFQQAASTRLWEVLNSAKGPQTEGDAERAKATYARLATPALANQYILDLTQAQAERDRMKANYYRDALPLAQKAGDLSEVDRRWSTRVPSIWNMPSMKRWRDGVQ